MSAERSRRAQLEVLQAEVRELRGGDDALALAAATEALEARRVELEASISRVDREHALARIELDEVAGVVAFREGLRLPYVLDKRDVPDPMRQKLLPLLLVGLALGGYFTGRLLQELAPISLALFGACTAAVLAWLGHRRGRVRGAIERSREVSSGKSGAA